MSGDTKSSEKWDEAMQDRLGELGNRSVDTSGIESRLSASLDALTDDGAKSLERSSSDASWLWRNRRFAIAALILLGVGVSWALISTTSSIPKLSVDELVAAHRHYVEGEAEITTVASFTDANLQVQSVWSAAPKLPQTDLGQVEACCVHQMECCRAGCVHMKYENQSVTLAVSHSKHAQLPKGDTFQRDGRVMTANEIGNLRMVSFSESNRCVCVIGSLPTESLATLAGSLRFDGVN